MWTKLIHTSVYAKKAGREKSAAAVRTISISKSVSISIQRDFHNMIYDMVTFNNILNLSCPHATQIFTYKQRYLASDTEQTFLVKQT